MKTTITIEDGKVMVQVDDQSPVTVKTSPPIPAVTPPAQPPAGPVPAAAVPKLVQPAAAPAPDDRKCEICGKPLAGLDRRAKVCSKDCRDEKGRRYQADKYKAEHNGQLPAQPVQKRSEVGEEQEVTKMMEEQRRNFTDPWDCQMCRNAGDLCNMHESMTREGKKPPTRLGVPQ